MAVHYEVDDAVAIVTIDRPEVANAVGHDGGADGEKLGGVHTLLICSVRNRRRHRQEGGIELLSPAVGGGVRIGKDLY